MLVPFLKARVPRLPTPLTQHSRGAEQETGAEPITVATKRPVVALSIDEINVATAASGPSTASVADAATGPPAASAPTAASGPPGGSALTPESAAMSAFWRAHIPLAVEGLEETYGDGEEERQFEWEEDLTEFNQFDALELISD